MEQPSTCQVASSPISEQQGASVNCSRDIGAIMADLPDASFADDRVSQTPSPPLRRGVSTSSESRPQRRSLVLPLLTPPSDVKVVLPASPGTLHLEGAPDLRADGQGCVGGESRRVPQYDPYMTHMTFMTYMTYMTHV